MSEHAKTQFQRLFEVKLFHHYWLDEGATVFDLLGDQVKKQIRLQQYSRTTFMDVKPTPKTAHKLGSLGGLFKDTAHGFMLMAPRATFIPADTVLDFVLTVKDSRFYNYTAQTLRSQKVYELFNPLDKLVYRYKENVPVLSNSTGTPLGTGAGRALFLSRMYPPPAPDDQVESLVLSGNALLELTSDNPDASTQQLSAQAQDAPVYLHQGDAPLILPAAGTAGAPARGIRLSEDIADDVFAVLSLTAVNASNDEFSFVDAAGQAKPVAPVYQLRFKNRSTIWNYLDKKSGAPDSSETHPLPLTHFGNAGTKEKPSAGFVKAEKSGTKITRLVSEIYI